MQGYKSKENIKKKRKISKVFKCLVFHLILLAFLPINTRVSGNTLQYEFRAIGTRPLFMGNTHHPLFMCNMHLSEFREIRTNLNSVQQAHVLYSWAIRTILCSCAIRTCLNFVQYTPIWISCNKHTSCIILLAQVTQFCLNWIDLDQFWWPNWFWPGQ